MDLGRKDINLDAILNTALDDPEIAQGIDASNLAKDFYRREIQARSQKIWSAASSELEHLAQVEGNLERVREGISKGAPPMSGLQRFFVLHSETIHGFFLLGIVSGIAIWVIGGLFIGFGAINSKFPWPWIVGTILGAWVAIGIVQKNSQIRHQRIYRRYANSSELKTEAKELEKAIATARTVVQDVLLERGIKSELRAIINAETQPNYSSQLSVRKAPGLAEVFDPAYEIPTESKNKVLQMLSDMPGGSIGIAGPRGAGKSTLIWSLCRGAITDLKGRPLFAMMTSAPVKYDGREFILHLFSSLCALVLGGSKEENFLPSNDYSELATPAGRLPSILRPLARAGPALLVTGATLIGCGWLLATELAKAPAAKQAHDKTATSEQPATPSPQPSPASGPTWAEILKATDVKPAPFLFAGIIFLATGAVALVFTASNVRRVYRKDPNAIPGATDRAIEKVGRDIVKKASDLLRGIRFQQSYSSGWSGSLKVPIGIEGSVNAAMSLAERQRSLPEVVDAYRDFIRLLAAKNAVLIGIDELDKLESDETAQQFLNEIKSIFGLDHCYYLISVSENAISSFERRGLPFRDAFDSAFDSIIHVDYLTLDNAKRLLKRRVIGLEVPFMCLCYCLSGGLARDLVRSCRDMIERVRVDTAPTDLGSICEQLVISDVQSKLRAIEVSLKRHRIEPDLSLAVDRIRRVEDATTNRQTFLDARRNLEAPAFVAEQGNGTASEAQQKRHAIADLTLELHTYLYFAATLLEFFTNNLSQQQLTQAERTGEITRLARAKQSFAVNAYTALSILDEFRAHNGLSTI